MPATGGGNQPERLRRKRRKEASVRQGREVEREKLLSVKPN